MKKSFVLGLMIMMTISALLFSGCSMGGRLANRVQKRTVSEQNNNNSAQGNTVVRKNLKDVTDEDLLNASSDDSSTQLDSIDNQADQLNSDDLDTLLNDSSDIDNLTN
ncbi:MAG: hypothetical protein Q8936_10605 [Bacillota bacterium]|nr:hypothetical protein [Bacillota bacterium]